MENPDDPDDLWVGKVVKRVGIEDSGGPGLRGRSGERDFYRVMDRIIFDDGREVIRLGYYTKRHEEPEDVWRWGSQTTFSATVEDLEELLKRGREEGVW